MRLKQLLTILGLSALTFLGQAKTTTTQVTVKTELASPVVLADEQQQNYLKISLIGHESEQQTRVPINLALVIDRSTSMSGDRIEKAREAAIMAINLLNEDDTISVVAYDSDAKVVIPATKVIDKTKLIKTINEQIQARGMTALFAGLSKGINQLDKFLDKEKVNRVILLSDGEANVGPTSVNQLSELAKIAAKKSIAVTTIGIGEGYNEALMAAIASYSDGNHAFVEKSSDLEAVFVREFKDVMSVVAQEVTVTITLNDGVKPLRLLGREGEISDNMIKVKMNQLYADQEKYVLLEFIPELGRVDQQKNVASISVNYDDLINKTSANAQTNVTINYTSNKDLVKDSIIEEVVAESVLQKVAIENERALDLYNRGNIPQAQAIMLENSEKLKDLQTNFTSDKASSRIMEQAIKNQIMADSIDEVDADVYLKKATEMQFDLKQNSIKQK